MNSIIMSILSVLLIQPMEQAITARLEQVRTPRAIVEQVAACARQAAPGAVDRVTSDPVWAASTVVQFWLGTKAAETILVEVAPQCDGAVSAARPFLTGRQA